MLTQFELKVLDLVYHFNCKIITIPFCWNGDRMALKSKSRVLYVITIRMLVLLGLVLRTSIIIQTNDINGLILGGLMVLSCASDVIFQINICLYQAEFVELTNQILHMNSSWGQKLFNYLM